MHNHSFIIILSAQVLSTFASYRITSRFFNTKKTSTKIKVCFILYYIFNTFMYIHANVPILMLLSNLFCWFFLASLFKGTLRETLLFILLFFSYTLVLESLILVIITHSHFIITESIDPNLIGTIIQSILLYASSHLYYHAGSKPSNHELPMLYWITLLSLPITTILLSLIIINNISNVKLINISLFTILAINLLIFYLFSQILDRHELLLEREKYKEQLLYQEHEISTSKKAMDSLHRFRHDISNHLLLLDLHYKNNPELAHDYSKQIQEALLKLTPNIQTNNPSLDQLLNYKISIINSYGVHVKHNIFLSEKINMSTFDQITLFSNLLDNAIDSLAPQKAHGHFTLIILKKAGLINITCKNSYIGNLEKKEDGSFATKKDPFLHGRGLKNIQEIIKKYDGQYSINTDHHIFTFDILLYDL